MSRNDMGGGMPLIPVTDEQWEQYYKDKEEDVHAEYKRLGTAPCGAWHPGNSTRPPNTLRCTRSLDHVGCHEAGEDGDLIRWWDL